MPPLRLRHTIESGNDIRQPQTGWSSPFLPLLRCVVHESVACSAKIGKRAATRAAPLRNPCEAHGSPHGPAAGL